MSFIIVPHLAPDHESHLGEILSRHTSMPVEPILDGLRPVPNHVYVLPPGKRLTISSGLLKLEPRPSDGRAVMVIDRFFRSLAADQKNHVIGIVLSGTDSDGALGLKTIKGEGGIAIVQDPDSAEFATMPRSGILADHVDLVLPPHEIGRELARLARRFFEPVIEQLEQGGMRPGDETHFSRILTLLRSVSGVDFRFYKPATLRRRTGRRMMLKRIGSLAEYSAYVQKDPEELHRLQEDVLINVTRFFRDPDVFDTLRTEVLPRIFENRPTDQQVRIWVAGCSTGEEAYSIAISLVEFLAGHAIEPPIQIFGTDASGNSIEKARTAIYPESISADISPERLRRFFVKTDHGYQVSKRIRDLCIFARQNLCNDPPFSRLDLVSCRNVLIYLGPEIQHRIVTTFHYALRPNGFLLLGNAESIREHAELFTPIDRKHKAYAKVNLGTAVVPNPIPRFSPSDIYEMGQDSGPHETLNEAELQRAADRIVLARYTPPGVVINDRMEVIQVRGNIGPYLQIAPGMASLHLIRMARDEFGSALRDAVRRAIADDVPVTLERVSLRSGDDLYEFKVDVLPMHGVSGRNGAYLVAFLPVLPAKASSVETEDPVAGSTGDLGKQVIKLRHDLASTRLYLQSLIEERDGRNQELTSAYEELQSANEELQSANEELETAKEELQSTNEELQTVNEELRNRNTALMHASNDLSNLLNSVNIPVVILGSDLTIRQYTPPAERLMRIRRQDLGRPITEIRLNLMVEELEPLLQDVLDTLAIRELEVRDREGHWHMLRVRPYRTSDNKIDGLVLVLLDIDHIRRSEESMREARDFSQSILETAPVPFVVLDSDLRIRSANTAFRLLADLKLDDVEKRSFPEMVQLLWNLSDLRVRLEKLRDTGPGSLDMELEHEVPGQNGRVLHFLSRLVQSERSPWLLVVIEDITARKRAERVLVDERDHLSGEIRNTALALDRTKNELRALAGRLFTSQEEERRRVARELHDDLGQKLAVLDVEMDHVLRDIGADPEQAHLRISSLKERLASLANDVRVISHRLHPSVLEDLGLAAALKALVDEFGRREKMPATFRRRNVPDKLPSEVAAALYRIAQEALRNIAKHAGHTHVKVMLDTTGRDVRLTVRDSGEGFDQNEIQEPGLGLISMQERAKLIGGELSIESDLGEGTTVKVVVPMG
jgi:two-component system CheB/CheR fusion protein